MTANELLTMGVKATEEAQSQTKILLLTIHHFNLSF